MTAFADLGLFDTQEQRDLVTGMCVAAEPHHGRKWPEVAKGVKSLGKSTAEILELVASAMREIL